MKDFSQQFEIIYKKFQEAVVNTPIDVQRISRQGMADFLGISQGKMQAWQRGQWPLAQDLATIAQRLGLSYRWLVTGEGNPEEEGPAPAPHSPAAPQAKPMPLVGLASCGVLGLEQIMPFAMSASPLTLGPHAVAVVASGDSMVPAGIATGQVCYCDPGQEALPGEAVYVTQPDNRGTLKILTERTQTALKLKGWMPPDDKGARKEFFVEIPADMVATIAPVIFVRRRV